MFKSSLGLGIKWRESLNKLFEFVEEIESNLMNNNYMLIIEGGGKSGGKMSRPCYKIFCNIKEE